MFGHPKDNFFTRINFEVYCQNHPITPEAGGKRFLFKWDCPKHAKNSKFSLLAHL